MKNYPKTTLLSAYLPLQSTKGVFIGKRGTKGAVRSRALNLGARLHKIAVETRHAVSPAARFPDIPLSGVLAGFQIWAPGFDETTLQSQ